MILIADSGSTKCNWALCNPSGKIESIYSTVGFNPKFNSYKDIFNELSNSELINIKNNVQEVYFYGAGCSSKKRISILEKPLQNFFENSEIIVRHDLEAALKATYRESPLICCILGTGSNSCFYNGREIVENAPSLGYIAGDEASGNFFGKKLINLYVNKMMDESLVKRFEHWTDERKEDIIDNIYSSKRPNLYLASFFPFLYENRHEIVFEKIILSGIQEFFDLHIKCFKNYHQHPISFVGSVAFYLSDYLEIIAEKEKCKISEIIQSPINNLVKNHFSVLTKKPHQ